MPGGNLVSSAGVLTDVSSPAYVGGISSIIGTTLPASPVTGDRYILVDSVSNPAYRWQFCYNGSSGSAYKWEFIGGSWAINTANAAGTTTSVTATDLTGGGVGPSITVPRAGDYQYEMGVSYKEGGGSTIFFALVSGAGTSNIDSAGSLPSVVTNNEYQGGVMYGRVTGRSASEELRMRYLVGAGTESCQGRWLRVRPIRVS
jgi:hypothetical protein